MNILGIENRTENWRTACYFSPFFRDKDARLNLAKELLARHLRRQPSDVDLGTDEVCINLFWYGVRDYIAQNGGKKPNDDNELLNCYRRLFSYLSSNIEGFNKSQERNLRKLQHGNYDVSREGATRLGSNLVHTEIDIVLQLQNYLFIGEAKFEEDLGTNGNHVLVHQLIRQYVMARILLDRVGVEKKIVPFVIRPKPEGREQSQVSFTQ